MQGFALFRLPYTKTYTLVEGQVRELLSCAELSGQSGFVISPFCPSQEHPVLMISPERVEQNGIVDCPELPNLIVSEKDARADYHIDFANFHAHLLNGDFQKLVLARSIDIFRQSVASPLQLFHKACQKYPRMMITLVSTGHSGLWMAATPEILLSGSGNQWQTVALAGTMPFSDQVNWSDKNIQEQHYVATYVAQQLEQFADHFTEEGPYTIRAGHLAHLRSDFRFTLSDNTLAGPLLQALHPTPAVCGLPKQEAFRFILANEHHDRSYYSGFMGPFFINGQTNIFVTLRCMQLFQNACRLYAGGGLLKDSNEEQEWQETEDKLDTMRLILKQET